MTGVVENIGREIQSLAGLVTGRIRERIITGEFKPNQQLKEDELCKMFGVSRPPIREAFKTLEAAGLVEHKARRGVFVTEFTAKDIKEIYTIVGMIYKKAAEMAVSNVTDDYLDIMTSHVKMMEDSAKSKPPNLREYQSAHSGFHETIMEMAGNERLAMLDKQFRYQVLIISYYTYLKPERLTLSLDFHRNILNAFKKRNTGECCLLMENHVIHSMNYLVNQFQKKKEAS